MSTPINASMTSPTAGLRRRHGHSAFTWADRADAKRGYPAVSLARWAASRELALREPAEVPQLAAGLPEHAEYVHELAHGTFSGEREGALFHELLPTHWGQDDSRSGGFWCVKITSQTTVRRALTPDKSDLPYIGWPFEPKTDEQPSAAFGMTGAWAPCTRCAVAIPGSEDQPALTGGVRSRIITRRGDHRIGRYSVMSTGREPSAVGAVDLPALEVALEAVDANYVEIGREAGVVWTRRNGYVTEPAELDRFVQAAIAVAAALTVS